MDVFNINQMSGGWWGGNFQPACFQSSNFEVCHATHTSGQYWQPHYHKIATEYNLLINGRMLMHDKEIKASEIFVLKPYEIANPVFLEDCCLTVIKSPSVKGDKYLI